MKKILMAVIIVVEMIILNCTTVQAAEDRMTVVPVGNRMVRELSEGEFARLSVEMSQEIRSGAVSELSTADSSYTAYEYSESFNFYFDGDWVARADARCIVWHYTDGKVHLYQRSIQVTKLISIGAARMYGDIVNTDGSYSYTTGDRVHLFLDEGTWSYAIDFYVSGDNGDFNCYRVN